MEAVAKMLPCPMSPPDVKELVKLMASKEDISATSFVTSKEVCQTRKLLNGMVIGGLDKNLHELWVTCPVLYEKTLTGLYNPETGYNQVTFRKATGYQLKKHGPE